MKFCNHYFFRGLPGPVRAYTSTDALLALAETESGVSRTGLGHLHDVRREDENGGPPAAWLDAVG